MVTCRLILSVICIIHITTSYCWVITLTLKDCHFRRVQLIMIIVVVVVVVVAVVVIVIIIIIIIVIIIIVIIMQCVSICR